MKKLFYLLVLFLIALQACNNFILNSTGNSSLKDYPQLKAELGKKNFTPLNNFFILNKSSNSSCQITWGNNDFTWNSKEEVDFYLANRLHYQWENSDYLILKGGTGSGAWINIVLPFNKSEELRMFDNTLCFDSKDNLIAYQYFSTDTVLVVHNLKTEQKQFIILKDTPCGAASNLYCIDSINIINKELHLKWATLHLASDSSRILIDKKIQINI